MKLLILPNLEKKDAKLKTQIILERLFSLGCKPMMPSLYRELFSGDGIIYSETENLLTSCDSVIVLGGDGTIIHSAKLAAAFKKPVLGINSGRLGYMASLEFEELDLFGSLVDGNYTVENRMMISAEIKGCNPREFFALNDIVISRGSLSRIIDIYVKYGSGTPFHYRADGLIFATPTGSTAYSLSAGGPVIDPNVKSILLTPICPHSLFSRSIIFDESSVIGVLPNAKGESEVYLTVDGDESVRLYNGDSVEIKKCEINASFIQIKDKCFADTLNDKFTDRS